MTMDPESGLSRPTSVLRKTDLPVPEGPSMTEISPAGRVSVTSFQMTWDPNRLVRPSTLISTPTAHLVVKVNCPREGPGSLGITTGWPRGYGPVAPDASPGRGHAARDTTKRARPEVGPASSGPACFPKEAQVT